MTETDGYDTTEKVEQTETGYRLTVKCKRGTGTRDEDKVSATARAESLSDLANERPKLTANVKAAMEDMRMFDPDATEENNE